MLPPLVDGTEALCDVLQLLGSAAVIVDSRGEVVGLNDAARDCVGAGLHIRNRRLVTVDLAANRALTRLIAEPPNACGTQACAEGQVVVARRDSRPLILRIVRLRGALPFDRAHAIVMVLDPRRVVLPTETQLKTAFGLSCGEARLAIRLAAGETLESAAGICGISYETARKRVKAAFEKTDTRRQSELVALVIRVGTLAGAAGIACAPAPPRLRRPLPRGARAPSPLLLSSPSSPSGGEGRSEAASPRVTASR
jgi:DNA-binding CsgD family transcriptional regulator